MTDAGSGAETPQYVVARLQEALVHDARVAALDIAIRIVGRDIFVIGAVTTEARQRAVADVVRDVLPDYELHNQLRVLDQRPPEAPEPLS